MNRCLNIDWLEVYCLEPPEQTHNADYFRNKGYSVTERQYGTRVYAEMFTIMGTDNEPLLEIRRQPLSSNLEGGIMQFNACHVRLCNRTCYFKDCVKSLKQFLEQHNYKIERVARIDLCLDFEYFDSGDDPQKFIMRYMRGKYSKINQANVRAFGDDTWEQREWNSLSWGKLKSPIGTKLYCKTMELKQVKDKPYIRQAWFEAGLIDDPVTFHKLRKDGTLTEAAIWRLEFSIKSAVQNWVTIEEDGNYQKFRSLRNTLDVYEDPQQLYAMFQSLVQHYFHFKKFQSTKTKYECKDKVLFQFSSSDTIYKVEHPSVNSQPDTLTMRLLKLLQVYRQQQIDPAIVKAVDTIIDQIQANNVGRYCQNRFSREQIIAMQIAIQDRLKGKVNDTQKLLQEIEQQIRELKPGFF